jgi:hypothetical protein
MTRVRQISCALLLAVILLCFRTSGYAQHPGSKEVEYLSDVAGSGYEWLEQQQRKAYGDKCKPSTFAELLKAADQLPEREGWKSPEELFRSLGFDRVALPTRCEGLGGFLILNRIAEQIRTTAKKESGDVQKIVWGTLPFREVNASAQRVGRDYVVALDTALFPFLYSLFLTVDRTIIIEEVGGKIGFRSSPADLALAVQQTPSVVGDFSALIVAFAQGKGLPDIEFAKQHEAPFVIRQLNGTERFIVGHEFGHVLAGHTDRGLRFLSLPAAEGGFFRVPSLGRDWSQELEADEIGQRLGAAARTQDESGLTQNVPLLFEAIAAYAPALFLQIADALDDAIFCGASGEGSVRQISDSDRASLTTQISALRDQGKTITVGDDFAKMLGCRQDGHPPAWLRAEFALRRADKKFIVPPRRPAPEVSLVRALVANSIMLSQLAAPEIKRQLSQ